MIRTDAQCCLSSPNRSTIKEKRLIVLPSAKLAQNPMLYAVLFSLSAYKLIDMFPFLIRKRKYKYSVTATNKEERYIRTFGKFDTKKECQDCIRKNKEAKKEGWRLRITNEHLKVLNFLK